MEKLSASLSSQFGTYLRSTADFVPLLEDRIKEISLEFDGIIPTADFDTAKIDEISQKGKQFLQTVPSPSLLRHREPILTILKGLKGAVETAHRDLANNYQQVHAIDVLSQLKSDLEKESEAIVDNLLAAQSKSSFPSNAKILRELFEQGEMCMEKHLSVYAKMADLKLATVFEEDRFRDKTASGTGDPNLLPNFLSTTDKAANALKLLGGELEKLMKLDFTKEDAEKVGLLGTENPKVYSVGHRLFRK
jgi:hypothetical protein